MAGKIPLMLGVVLLLVLAGCSEQNNKVQLNNSVITDVKIADNIDKITMVSTCGNIQLNQNNYQQAFEQLKNCNPYTVTYFKNGTYETSEVIK